MAEEPPIGGKEECSLRERGGTGPDLVAEFRCRVGLAALDGDERAMYVYSTASRPPQFLKINVFVVGEGRHLFWLSALAPRQ